MATTKLSLHWGEGNHAKESSLQYHEGFKITSMCKYKTEIFEIMYMIGSSGEVNWDNTMNNITYQSNSLRLYFLHSREPLQVLTKGQDVQWFVF